MRKFENISPYMRRPFVIYDFTTAPLWISVYIFFFISVGLWGMRTCACNHPDAWNWTCVHCALCRPHPNSNTVKVFFPSCWQKNAILWCRNFVRICREPESMIYRGPGFLAVVWFSSSPTPIPSSVSKLSSCEFTEGRGGGEAKSYDGEKRLVLYKLFYTLCHSMWGCTSVRLQAWRIWGHGSS